MKNNVPNTSSSISKPLTDEIPSYICVDVETAGPNPFQYSILSIGACTVSRPRSTFYIELRPINQDYQEDALAVSQLSMERLAREGVPPGQALHQFDSWLNTTLQEGTKPIFVAFNAPFDWMFVCDYFHRFMGYNPFGYAALDIKALYMGLRGNPWRQTSMRQVSRDYASGDLLSHNALQDALDQADIFEKMLAELTHRRNN